MLNFDPTKNPSGTGNSNNGSNNSNNSITGSPGTGGSAFGSGYPVPPSKPIWKDDGNMDITDLLINYNTKFQHEKPTLFRDELIKQTLSCLIGKYKPNALLIGAAGVGKTKIVEDIARRIANNDPLIPGRIKKSTIWELPISNIVSGSGLVGDVEAKTKAIIEFASDPDNDVILFIDEIHMLIGESQTYEKIAQIMKPVLARGDIRVIGATTLQEAQSLMKDPAFNRRFTRLIVDELDQEQTKVILQQIVPDLFEHYEQKVLVNDATIDLAINIADEYKTVNSHRPDNAITLLDRTMAETLISMQALEEKATRENDQALLAALPSTQLVSKRRLTDVATKLITGNNKAAAVNFTTLVTELSAIKGQNDSLNEILELLQREELKLHKKTKPLTFMLAGKSGTGKTETAKILAKNLTGSDPIILNMTEYHSPASINRIIGSPAGYVGSDSKQEYPFDILESNPTKLILLDEFEKGDASVQKLFMSAFDEGYIKMANGKIVDFSRSIIIATTNAAADSISSNTIGFGGTSAKTSGETYCKELSSYFDIALLNRFTKILQFNPITESLFKEIILAKYAKEASRIRKEHSSYKFIPLTMDKTVADELTEKHYNSLFGARPVNDIVQKYIEDLVIKHKSPIVLMEDVPVNTEPDTNTDNSDITAVSADNDTPAAENND